MHIFDCTCEWRFIVGNKHVYGPIIGGFRATHGKKMTWQRFRDEYGDCAGVYDRKAAMEK